MNRALPQIGVSLLIASTALNLYQLNIGSLTIRPEHFAFALVGGAWIIRSLRARERPTLLPDDVLLALYLGVALLASILNAPVLRASLQFLGIMGIGMAVYWLVRALTAQAAVWRGAVKRLLIVGCGAALFGILAWVVYPLNLNLGVRLYPFGAARPAGEICDYTYAPYGTLTDSNIFGSYLVGISLILIVLILSNQFRLRSWLAVGAFIVLITIGLTLSRGAWVAWLVGLGLAVGVTEIKPLRIRLGVIAAMVALLAMIVIADVELSSRIIHLPSTPKEAALFVCADYARAQAVEQGTTGTLFEPPTEIAALNSFVRLTGVRLFAEMSVSQRARTYARAFADWLQQPWIGNGANTFGQKYSKLQGVDPWISNVTVMALHDTGIIGFALLGAWFVWIGYDALRTIKRASAGGQRTMLLALSIGLLALLVAYQFATALWLGFTWVYLGLIRAGTLLLQQKDTDVAGVPPSGSHSF